MAHLVFSSAQSHTQSTSDGNTCTEDSAGIVQKLEFSDELGAAIDSNWTTGMLDATGTERGSVTEASGIWTLTTTRESETTGRKGIYTAGLYNTVTWEVWVDNWTRVTAEAYTRLRLWVDANNYARIERVKTGAIDKIQTIYIVAGTPTSTLSVNTAVTSFGLRLSRVIGTNVITADYNIGAGWVTLKSAVAAIGANCQLEVSAHAATADGSITFDVAYARISGSGILWNHNEVVVWDAINVGAGYTIPCGDTTGTFDATTLIDIKFGTAAWITGKTKAEIIALGDQVTDNGNVQIRTTHGNSTAQSGFTTIDLGEPVAPVSVNAAWHHRERMQAILLGA